MACHLSAVSRVRVGEQPVQPLLLRYTHKFMDPCFVDAGPDLLTLLARLMSQFYNNVSLVAALMSGSTAWWWWLWLCCSCASLSTR